MIPTVSPTLAKSFENELSCTAFCVGENHMYYLETKNYIFRLTQNPSFLLSFYEEPMALALLSQNNQWERE